MMVSIDNTHYGLISYQKMIEIIATSKLRNVQEL